MSKENGISYSAGHTWHPTPHETSSFQTGYFASMEEAHREAALVLRGMGYKAPRWWEYWRWGERKPGWIELP